MGVDFYTCANCGENFPDCGSFFPCDCGEFFCSPECGKREEDEDSGETTCRYCRCEDVTVYELLRFALKKLGLTEEQLKAEAIAAEQASKGAAEGGQ